MLWEGIAYILLPLRQLLRGNGSQEGPWSLRGEVALPEDTGKVCGILALVIPRAGSPCSPPSG